MSLTVQTDQVFDVDELKLFLSDKFPDSDINVRLLSSAGSQIGFTIEAMDLTETFTAQSLDYGVEFVLGPQTPDGVKRVFVIGGSTLG